MSQHDDIDDARAALIDQRISQSFAFLGDVIDEPRLLDSIPDGSRLAFRDVTIHGGKFRLTLYLAPNTHDHWSALVTGYTRVESHVGDFPRTTRTTAEYEPVGRMPDIQSGNTAQAALDALETELRALVIIPA